MKDIFFEATCFRLTAVGQNLRFSPTIFRSGVNNFWKWVLVHNPNGISICSTIFAQLTTECLRACSGTTFPIKLPIHTGDLDPHLNTRFLGPIRVQNPNGISIGSAVLPIAECCRRCVHGYAIFFLKIVPSHWEIWTPSNTWFLGSTRLSIQTTSRSVSRLCTAHGRLSLYFTMGPFPKIATSNRDLHPHVMRGSL